ARSQIVGSNGMTAGMTIKGIFFMTGLYYPSPAALAKRNQLRDAVGKGELARLARTGRRPADQPGRQFPTPFSYASRAAEALGGTPRAATETARPPSATEGGSRSRSQSHR